MRPGTIIYFEHEVEGRKQPEIRLGEVCFWATETTYTNIFDNPLPVVRSVVYIVDYDSGRIWRIDPLTIMTRESKRINKGGRRSR